MSDTTAPGIRTRLEAVHGCRAGDIRGCLWYNHEEGQSLKNTLCSRGGCCCCGGRLPPSRSLSPSLPAHGERWLNQKPCSTVCFLRPRGKSCSDGRALFLEPTLLAWNYLVCHPTTACFPYFLSSLWECFVSDRRWSSFSVHSRMADTIITMWTKYHSSQE